MSEQLPFSNPIHLPAVLPATAGLLRRTQAVVNLLQEVVQESSAEHWYERGKDATAREAWEEAIIIFQNCLSKNDNHQLAIYELEIALRNNIKSICDSLKEKRTDKKYDRWRESKYEGGSAYSTFDERLWRDDNEDLFNKIISLHEALLQINNSPPQKAGIWIEAARLFDGLPFRHPKLASYCYCKAFSFEGKFETYISECCQCAYFQSWSNWSDCWNQERIMSLDAAIERFPDYYETYWLRGERNLGFENYQKAASDFEAYFHLGGPEIRWRYQSQAKVYFKLNNYQKFKNALANLIRLGGNLIIKDGELIDPHENDLPF